jgi:HAMP domain-containing protein
VNETAPPARRAWRFSAWLVAVAGVTLIGLLAFMLGVAVVGIAGGLPLVSGLALVVAGLILVAAVYVDRRIIDPIERLTQAAHRLVEGDLGETVSVDGTAEVNALADACGRRGRMLGRKVFAPRRLYQCSLEAQVPEEHLLRRLAAAVDFGSVRRLTARFYRHTGRPGIDPEALFKLGLLGYLYPRWQTLLEESRLQGGEVAVGVLAEAPLRPAGLRAFVEPPAQRLPGGAVWHPKLQRGAAWLGRGQHGQGPHGPAQDQAAGHRAPAGRAALVVAQHAEAALQVVVRAG